MKVLIVDDEALVRRSLSRAFKAKGHSVFEAVDGEDGLAEWKRHQPDLILLDVLMPKVTGPQLLKSMDDRLGARVILMSAYSGEDYSSSLSSLADEFIAKPFQNIFEVVKRAEQLIGGRLKNE